MNVLELFAGVGGFRIGLENSDKNFFKTRWSNQWEPSRKSQDAFEVYNYHFPNSENIGYSISDISDEKFASMDADMIVGGFPCQAFSIAGYRKGFDDDRGELFFELLRMIEGRKPRAIFIENVKNMVGHDHGNTFKVIREALTENNYFIKWKVLNGKDYGNIPQNRERIYIVGFDTKEAYDIFEFPEEVNLTTSLSDVIDFGATPGEAFYYREGKQRFYDELKECVTSQDTVYQWRRQYVRENKNGVVPTLTANMGTGGHNVPLILTDSGEIRKLTPKETFNVQGYPKTFKLPEGVSNGQLYKQAGNSVVVPVIKRIAENVAKALNKGIGQSQHNRSGNIAIIYIKMNGQFEGESYVKDFVNNEAEAYKKIYEEYDGNLEVITDEQYRSLIRNKKSKEFYMLSINR